MVAAEEVFVVVEWIEQRQALPDAGCQKTE